MVEIRHFQFGADLDLATTRLQVAEQQLEQGRLAGTVGAKQTGTITELAAFVGVDIAKKAKKAKITTVVFDRNGRQYAGRLAALADAARKEGLEF